MRVNLPPAKIDATCKSSIFTVVGLQSVLPPSGKTTFGRLLKKAFSSSVHPSYLLAITKHHGRQVGSSAIQTHTPAHTYIY